MSIFSTKVSVVSELIIPGAEPGTGIGTAEWHTIPLTALKLLQSIISLES
jgi:hypothetical protein